MYWAHVCRYALRLGLAAGLLTAAALCVGEETPAGPPLVLTPLQAGELAMAQALEVQLADEAVASAQAGVDQVAAGRGLQAGLGLTEGRAGPVSTFTIDSNEITVGSDLIRNGTLSVTQPLYTGKRVEHGLEAARAGVSAAEESAEAARRSLRLAAQQAAFGVLRAQELAGVARRLVGSAAQHLTQARQRLEAGTAPQFEVVQAQTSLSTAEGHLIAAETGVQQALAGLRRLLYLPAGRTLQVTPPEEPLASPSGDTPLWVDTAWRERPELGAAQARVQQAEAGVRLAQVGLNPTVALSGQFVYQQSASVFATPISWQAALVLNQPLMDGGQTRAQVHAAESALKSAQLALEVQRQDIALEIIREKLALEQAVKQLQVATQGVVEAQERRRIAGVRFEAGVGVGLEVLDAQVALAATEAAQVNANYDLHTALIRLYYAMGQPLGGEVQP